jgi:hypothetical protein|nr:MAG TPA: hypothetical protein [Caudoviricetes sp.]
MKALKKNNIKFLIVILIGYILGNLTIVKEIWEKNLELRGVLLTLFGSVLGFLITSLNNFFSNNNINKNLEKTIENNKENLEKEQKFKEKLEEKKFLREKLEIIANEILEDNRKINLIFYKIYKTSVQEVKKNITYERSYQKSFLLSLLYFEDLNYLIRHYEQRTAKLFELMNLKLTEKEESELFKKVYFEEYKEISVSFGERPEINNGRQGVYSEILKQLRIEAKKLVE